MNSVIVPIAIDPQRFLLASTFLSSSLSTDQHPTRQAHPIEGLTSAELRNPHSCHRRPSSPPIDAYYHLVPQCLLVSSLPSQSQLHMSPSSILPARYRANALSTGKSSNSSSSSNAAAGLTSFDESVLSEVVAFVCGAAPEAGAADIVEWRLGMYGRRRFLRGRKRCCKVVGIF